MQVMMDASITIHGLIFFHLLFQEVCFCGINNNSPHPLPPPPPPHWQRPISQMGNKIIVTAILNPV